MDGWVDGWMDAWMDGSVCPSVCLSVCLSVYLSICLSMHPSIHPSIHPSTCLRVYVSTYLCIYVSMYVGLYVYTSVCLYACTSVCRFVGLYHMYTWSAQPNGLEVWTVDISTPRQLQGTSSLGGQLILVGSGPQQRRHNFRVPLLGLSADHWGDHKDQGRSIHPSARPRIHPSI